MLRMPVLLSLVLTWNAEIRTTNVVQLEVAVLTRSGSVSRLFKTPLLRCRGAEISIKKLQYFHTPHNHSHYSVHNHSKLYYPLIIPHEMRFFITSIFAALSLVGSAAASTNVVRSIPYFIRADI